MTCHHTFTQSAKMGSEIRRMLRRRKAILKEIRRIDHRILALSRNLPVRISLDDCAIIDENQPR